MNLIRSALGGKLIDAAVNASEHTPPNRDRVVDLLRGWSLAVVVVGHVVMALIVWPAEGAPEVHNLLAEFPSAQILTWILQVMPLFFAAGAIANKTSYETSKAKGTLYQSWLWQRMRRLLRPVLYYLAAWIPLSIVLEMLLGTTAKPLSRLSTQLLWFIAVYIIVVAATPWIIKAASKGWMSVLAGVVATGLVDLGRFHLSAGVAVLNLIVVWFSAAVLGIVVRERVGNPRMLTSIGITALVANVAVVLFGPYPVSMVGMPGEKISNMAPPTIVLALHTVTIICIIGGVWNQLERLCAKRKIWISVNLVGGMAMTLYLWHLTALIGFTVGAEALGIGRPETASSAFWPATLLWCVTVLAVVWLVATVAAPLEYKPVPWWENPKQGTPGSVTVVVGGTLLAGVGLLSLAATGMYGFPTGGLTHYAGIPLTPLVGFVGFCVGLLAMRAGGTTSNPPATKTGSHESRQ